MIATSVAGRGLDVPEICCVINFNCPNHLEDYVHRVGRTGRAGRKGHAYTFISSKEEHYASLMIKILKRADIEPAAELVAMADRFKAKVSTGEAKDKNFKGFKGKGFKFDASEMNEAQKAESLQKQAYKMELGLDDDGDDGDEEDLAMDDNESQTIVSLDTKQTANSLNSSARLSSQDTNIATNSKISGHEKIAQAFLVARQLASKSGGSAKTAVYSQELDINDYPVQARKKCMQKQFTDELLDRTGVAIISRGSYVPPNVKLLPGEKRLHLLIEGDTEKNVKQAVKDITHFLDEETRKLRATSSSGGGRYNVL
jgi:ATP-dependent RNA helicase DDX46/PRP5